MTSRPGLGGPRQPQRSLSANIIQRPAPNRTLSQQFPPSSPVRRNNDGSGDLLSEDSAATLGYGTMPKNGSRLKLEISKDPRTPVLIESPRATEATPAWRPSLPPRGRPQLHFDVPSISHPSPRPSQDGANGEPTVKPMPLPVRPGQHAPPPSEKTRPIPVFKKDVRPKPYAMETPAAAPHYPANGVADFFPWTGNQPEDHYTETAIRQGHYDKAQMSQNETGSGKTSVCQALKNKHGLESLSTLFTSILIQRRSHGHITSSSTFKPPPRVTVTDTKREMWLKDLANSTIPLRRLSRSIPHGIRGKVLLDQSLSKSIPIERAVWLAKCVGANELRSFRRKGASGTFAMGGEAKWIRDFTVSVEQFVENAVNSCGEPDFKSRVNYAIRLATHFHAERLLDREHYMDWLVASLENSPQAKLPMWLLITQIYWKELLRYRKYGRRLATALLTHTAEITTHPDSDIMAPLADRLKSLVKDVFISSPESFVIPKVWMKHKDCLEAILSKNHSRQLTLFSSIDRRNTQLMPPDTNGENSSRRQLIALLDTTLATTFQVKLAKHGWDLDDDKFMLVQTILEWATSAYRPGPAKIYVGTRILRQWSRQGADVTRAILNFLDTGDCDKNRNRSAVYHLVSELARSEHFSVPVYLQWLISRGGIYEEHDIATDASCATRLLVELPTHNLSESMMTLRTTLLRRVGYLTDNEEDELETCKKFISMALPGMQANEDLNMESSQHTIDSLPSNASRSVKSEIGLWLRQKVRLQMMQPTIPPLDDWDDSPMKGGTSAITASEFNTIRECLEKLDDYSMLADVLKIVASSSDSEVLASCADTLSLHFVVFSAIGALNPLSETLMTRLRSLGEDESFPRVLLVALSDLAARIPDQVSVAQQLAQELIRSDRKTAADACSPVSDHMAGIMQSPETDFTDEMEKILASGNSMDQATLERLFQRISQELEESWKKSPEKGRSCGLLFTRLRTFDAQQFDVLMAAWVQTFLQLESRPSMRQTLAPLVSFGCLKLKEVVAICSSRIDTTTTTDSMATKVAQEMLSLLVGPTILPDAMTPEEMYRLRGKQSQFQIEEPLETLHVIRRAVESTSFKSEDFAAILDSQELFALLQRYIVVDPASTKDTLMVPCFQNADPQVNVKACAIVNKLLTASQHLSSEAQDISVETVLGLADDLTLPFCQLKLASMLSSSTDLASTEGGHELQAFDNAIESAVAVGNTTWTCIVPLLDVSIAQHLRSRAETQLLALFPSMKTLTEEDYDVEGRLQQAANLLYIIEATAYSIQYPFANSSLTSELVSAFNNCWLLVTSAQTQNKEMVFTRWLPLLLSFTIIHNSTFEATKSGNESRARTLLALAAILLELQALDTVTEKITSIAERTFDLGLQLVDLLPDDMRQQCIRGLRDTTSNSRIAYMFSIAPNPSEWLMLCQKERIGQGEKEKLAQFPLRRWEMLGEPTPNVGENDTSLSLTLFGARRG